MFSLFYQFVKGNGIPKEKQKIISDIIDLNRHKYEQEFWNPLRHLSFDTNTQICPKMIMSVLLCGSSGTHYLPSNIWMYIFSFWKRDNFTIYYYEADCFSDDQEDEEDEEYEDDEDDAEEDDEDDA